MTFEWHGMMVIKLLVGMVGVLFFLRLSGKSQMAQMAPTDTVNSFVIGAIVGGIIYTPELSVWDMLFAILIWMFINVVVRWLTKNEFFNHLIHGKSELIIKDGNLNLRAMDRNNLDIEELIDKLREQGIYSLLDVDDVRFETDGQLTVFKQQRDALSYLLVSNGTILKETLLEAGREVDWLKSELNKVGFSDVTKLYCVEWTPHRGFYIVDKKGQIQTLTRKAKVKELEEDATV